MGMGFPMGPGIPWESHGNGNKTQNWEWEWEGMGNHLSGNGNYRHSHGNLFPFPKVSRCDELIKLLELLPDANAYCAEFADYRNVIYSAPRAGLCIPSVRQTSTFPFLFIVVLSTCHCFGLFVTIMASKEDIQQLVMGMGGNGN